jgi:hypothetical protein
MAEWNVRTGLLEQQHLPTLPGHVQALLLARALGWRVAEIADALNRSEAACRRDLDRALDVMLVPLGMRGNASRGWAAGYWVRCHHDCCLAKGQAQIDVAPTGPER